LGPIAWLWTDDNSNYVGFYRTGILAGWITTCDHEEQLFAPAHQSVEGFLWALIGSARGVCGAAEPAYDAPSIPRAFPLRVDDAANIERHRALVSVLQGLQKAEADETLRRFYVMCVVVLTPVRDTAELLPFLRADDMWIPEAVANIFDWRQFYPAIPYLERLAIEGKPNGDSFAMRCLVRFDTDEARAAVNRLRTKLKGHKQAALEMWISGREKLKPAKWP
jgi:hypothetical protein